MGSMKAYVLTKDEHWHGEDRYDVNTKIGQDRYDTLVSENATRVINAYMKTNANFAGAMLIDLGIDRSMVDEAFDMISSVEGPEESRIVTYCSIIERLLEEEFFKELYKYNE